MNCRFQRKWVVVLWLEIVRNFVWSLKAMTASTPNSSRNSLDWLTVSEILVTEIPWTISTWRFFVHGRLTSDWYDRVGTEAPLHLPLCLGPQELRWLSMTCPASPHFSGPSIRQLNPALTKPWFRLLPKAGLVNLAFSGNNYPQLLHPILAIQDLKTINFHQIQPESIQSLTLNPKTCQFTKMYISWITCLADTAVKITDFAGCKSIHSGFPMVSIVSQDTC